MAQVDKAGDAKHNDKAVSKRGVKGSRLVGLGTSSPGSDSNFDSAILNSEEFLGRSLACEHSTHMSGISSWERFWKAVEERSPKGCCYKLDIPPGGIMGQKESQARGRNGLAQDITLQKKLEIAPDMAEAIYIRVVALRTVSLKINIDMKTDSRIMFRMIGEAHKNADLSIEIESTQSRRSNLSFQSRFLALDNSEINIKTLGRLPSEAIGARSFYDSKILQLGAEASVSGSPEMVIENDEVEAGHGFSVGSIPEEKILYLLGRGLNRDEARRLYAKGFLKEIV